MAVVVPVLHWGRGAEASWLTPHRCAFHGLQYLGAGLGWAGFTHAPNYTGLFKCTVWIGPVVTWGHTASHFLLQTPQVMNTTCSSREIRKCNWASILYPCQRAHRLSWFFLDLQAWVQNCLPFILDSCLGEDPINVPMHKVTFAEIPISWLFCLFQVLLGTIKSYKHSIQQY